MLSAYIIAAVVGIGLAAASAFLGHHDTDHDASFDHGHDFDHGGDADHDHGDADTDGPWIPFFSIRFWTYFLFGFGATGVLLHYLVRSPEPTTAITATSTGFMLGLLVAGIMRWLQKQQNSSMTSTKDLQGAVGRVSVAIAAGMEGKVRLTLNGETLDFLALSDQGQTIHLGSEVVVVSVENDRAVVMPITEISENQINA